MSTYERGKEPHGAPVTWERYESGRFVVAFRVGVRCEMATCVERNAADAICRAFHVAKLAEDYARACDESESTREADPFMETERSRALAAKCDAARDALCEAVR